QTVRQGVGFDRDFNGVTGCGTLRAGNAGQNQNYCDDVPSGFCEHRNICNMRASNVKCQPSHFECRMNLSSDPLTQLRNWVSGSVGRVCHLTIMKPGLQMRQKC